jgi:hypothetical protein
MTREEVNLLMPSLTARLVPAIQLHAGTSSDQVARHPVAGSDHERLRSLFVPAPTAGWQLHGPGAGIHRRACRTATSAYRHPDLPGFQRIFTDTA